MIWSDLTIGGATGSFEAPPTSDYYADLQSYELRDIYVSMYDNLGTAGLGLFKGGEEFTFIECWANVIGTVATFAGDSSVTPENTFYNGTYSISTAGGDDYIYTDNWANEYRAQFHTLTITGGIIPEPSTTGLWFGLTALGAVAIIRRRK